MNFINKINYCITNARLSFKSSTSIALLIITSLYLTISCYSIQHTVNNFIERTTIKAWMVENFINHIVDDSHQIMQVLSHRLKDESIVPHNQSLYKMVDNFYYELNLHSSLLIHSLKVYDTDNTTIYYARVPYFMFKPIKTIYYADLLNSIKKNQTP